ncbi:hypothetical protein M407DRAFT_4723 [Tulasnella calospora MUT 4182]|uniref:Uncharacterized protein n=1 Tax=Tulasnella calospora MUT 4182 TaxID=1051891 RepID=A0A0C3ME07_9AGAM|nr:hypothetical protein M407DRAFT_4723 [Tulasnella calospora MUT 4182]
MQGLQMCLEVLIRNVSSCPPISLVFEELDNVPEPDLLWMFDSQVNDTVTEVDIRTSRADPFFPFLCKWRLIDGVVTWPFPKLKRLFLPHGAGASGERLAQLLGQRYATDLGDVAKTLNYDPQCPLILEAPAPLAFLDVEEAAFSTADYDNLADIVGSNVVQRLRIRKGRIVRRRGFRSRVTRWWQLRPLFETILPSTPPFIFTSNHKNRMVTGSLHFRAVEKQLARERNSLVPINRLPTELLIAIFDASLETFSDRFEALHTIASVAWLWSSIVKRAPGLWAVLYSKPDGAAFLDMVLPKLARWKEAKLFLQSKRQAISETLGMLEKPAPLLRQFLSIWGIMENGPTVEDVFQWMVSSARLRSRHLSRGSIYVSTTPDVIPEKRILMEFYHQPVIAGLQFCFELLLQNVPFYRPISLVLVESNNVPASDLVWILDSEINDKVAEVDIRTSGDDPFLPFLCKARYLDGVAKWPLPKLKRLLLTRHAGISKGKLARLLRQRYAPDLERVAETLTPNSQSPLILEAPDQLTYLDIENTTLRHSDYDSLANIVGKHVVQTRICEDDFLSDDSQSSVDSDW